MMEIKYDNLAAVQKFTALAGYLCLIGNRLFTKTVTIIKVWNCI